ncbi:TetR/AcrR family transcriptional regulator [Gottfriedia sp. NPDC057991]|uniref:TetR/AcrR family transcriptional regulator n=1 Tax=Gottfriedia sp. NPDC057991 TaxID=3346298 RepID=UPI0036D7DE65
MIQKYEDPRIIRTRNLIIDAFTELISEKDLDHIYVKDITNRANINRATFYRHFANKEELYKYYEI